VKRGWSVAALGALVICVAGCGGGSSNGRLSSAEYKQELAKISKQSDAAHGAVEQSAPSAKTVARVQTVLRTFASAEDRIGNEVSKLKAPQNAEATTPRRSGRCCRSWPGSSRSSRRSDTCSSSAA
jgi:hypothetical protein